MSLQPDTVLANMARNAVLGLIEERLDHLGEGSDLTRYLSALVEDHLFNRPVVDAVVIVPETPRQEIAALPRVVQPRRHFPKRGRVKCARPVRAIAPPEPEPIPAAAPLTGPKRNVRALAPARTAEEAARTFILERHYSAEHSIAFGTLRIDPVEMEVLTGWPPSKCRQFISTVLDEIRAAGKVKPLRAPAEAGLGSLIAAINGPDMDDDEEDDREPADRDLRAIEPRKSTWKAPEGEALAKKREYAAMFQARKKRRENGMPFDEAAWRAGYRERKAAA